MMGIRFSGHPDLRRILMWEGYPIFRCAKIPAARQAERMPASRFTKPRRSKAVPFVTVAAAKIPFHANAREKPKNNFMATVQDMKFVIPRGGQRRRRTSFRTCMARRWS